MIRTDLTININNLDLRANIKEILMAHGVHNVKDLWEESRKSLKSYGLSDQNLNDIIIQLQLMSLDLNKKVYNKD